MSQNIILKMQKVTKNKTQTNKTTTVKANAKVDKVAKVTEVKSLAKTEKPVKATKLASKVKTTKVVATKKVVAVKEVKAKAKSKQIVFSLPKEAVVGVSKVQLLGDFNNWDLSKSTELHKQKDGSFKAIVELKEGKSYEYRFLIDGKSWANDWKAMAYVPSPYGTNNSVIIA
jgi:Glycogen recognition site of AMP-activated protein kinase